MSNYTLIYFLIYFYEVAVHASIFSLFWLHFCQMNMVDGSKIMSLSYYTTFRADNLIGNLTELLFNLIECSDV